MIITMPNNKTVSLKWAGRVGEWELTLPNRNNATLLNDSGLLFWFQTFANPHKKHDPHARHRCVRGYPWICPYMQRGEHTPCVNPRASDKRHLVTIESTNWERKQGFRPEGAQLSLFYQGYWQNVKTGEQRWTNEPRPYALMDVVCKEFGVASMIYQQRQWGWEGLKWRIVPVKSDPEWVAKQQNEHRGRFSACVFDVWD